MRQLPPDREAELGPAWAGSAVNCKPYAVEALVHARTGPMAGHIHGAFFDAEGRIAVYAAPEDGGAPRIAAFPVPRPPNDAHDTPALQIDAEGRLHVFGGSHRNRPFYLRSATGGNPESLRDVSAELPDDMADASYPSLLRPPGAEQLWLMYRLGVPHRSQWRVRAWDAAAVAWEAKARPLVTGTVEGAWSAGPYPNQPILFPDGRIGLVLCWRSQAVQKGRENPMNIGLDYLECREGFSRLVTGGGLGLSAPVSPANSERVVAVGWGADLANQSGACALDATTPAFVSSWRVEGGRRQIWFCWKPAGEPWRVRQVSDFAQDSALEGHGTLPMAFSRPVVVPAGAGGAVVLWRDGEEGGRLVAQPLSGPDYHPEAHPPVCLVSGGLDQYEPVAERLEAPVTGWLHLYVQAARQLRGGDGLDHRASAPASLRSWRIARLFG